MKCDKKKHKGFIAISSVLIIAAVVLSIGITTSLLSISEGQSALSLTKGEMALNLTEGCMEDSLSKILTNSNYSGGTLSTPEGVCLIVITKAGGDYIITSSNDVIDYKRSIEVLVKKSGNSLTITSWKEI